MKRKHIPLKVQLAAALLEKLDGHNRPLIPYEDSKQMTADQIISLFQLDHYPVRHADGGSDHPSNLTWRWIGEHREKTKRDVKEMAKSKRIRRKRKITGEVLTAMSEQEFSQLMSDLQADIRAQKRKRKIPSRPFPKGRKFKR
jgi:hypothetical protein